MNYYKFIMAISLSLLAATGCKSQNTTATSTVQVPQSGEQANSAESAAVPTAPNGDAAVAEADPNSVKMPPDPTGYVDIADWCRPGMTEPISAREWAKANNAFGLKFLAQTKGNTVFSPYSLERALGMTLDGACGTTAREMLAALDMPNAMRLSISGRDVDDAMTAVNENTTLEIENTLWPNVTMTLPDDYLARISAGYRNKTIKLDYGADPEKARQTINDDVAKTTHDRIKDLIQPGGVETFTQLVLTNAVYFKSKWRHPFKETETKSETFYNSDKQTKKEIMHQVGESHIVCIANDYAVYDLEFDSSVAGDKGAYIMRIVLPTINEAHPMAKRMEQLKLVEGQLSGDILSGCKFEVFDNVFVSLPKFKFEQGIGVNDILQSMGMKKAFDRSAAEFYAMPNTTPQPTDSSPYLFIDTIIHKAFLEIDEKGGEAAAATGVTMSSPSGIEPKPRKQNNYYFTVDHPFVYTIMEKSTGAAIFMGRVTDL